MIYFINETELKDLTPLSSNVPIEQLKNDFIIAQIQDIKPILGVALYDELDAAVQADTTTTDQDTLLAKIKPALAYFILNKSLSWMCYNISAKGVQKKTSDGGEVLTKSELESLRTEANNYAEFFAIELRTYLEANKSLYSNYRTYPLSKSRIYKSGVYFGAYGKRSCTCGCLEFTNCTCRY